jgi:hypothetical protein
MLSKMAKLHEPNRSVQGVGMVFSWQTGASGGHVENVETDTRSLRFPDGDNQNAVIHW